MNTIERTLRENPGAVLIGVSNVLPEILDHINSPKKNGETEFQEESPKIIDADKQIEIVDGEVEIKEMAVARHGGISARIITKIGIYLENNPIGNLYTADTLFAIGKNDRMPDVSFVSAKRIPENGEPEGQWEIAPDLAIEVISPTDVYAKILKKIREYLDAGVAQVWLVEPEFQTVAVYKSPMKSETFNAEDRLVCEEILPNFSLPVKEIFISRKDKS